MSKIYKPKSNHPGFTIVELLVVIVIIGILAAITTVSFTGISQKAKVASLQSDLSNASTQLKMHQANYGNYPATIDCGQADSATNKCIKSSPGNSFSDSYSFDNSANPQTYRLTATNGSVSYRVINGSAPTIVALVSASGGEVTNVDGYRVHTFNTNGTFTVNSGGSVNIVILGAGGSAGGPIWEDQCAIYGDGTAGGLSKISKSGVDWQANGGGGGSTDYNYCGGSGTGLDGALGTTNTPSGWISTNGGGSAGGSKYYWGSGADWEHYGGNGGSGGKLEKAGLEVATGDVYMITVGARGLPIGTDGKVIISYLAG